jgi:hypothetical protein
LCQGGSVAPYDADNFYRWAGACTTLTSKRCQPTAAAAALCTASVEGDPTGCAQCTGGEGTCNATDTIWAWAAALNTASFAGHTDWRAPTWQELQGIVDYADVTAPAVNAAFHGGSCGVGCTDITQPACSCTQPNLHWSASTYAPAQDRAWLINFFDGFFFFGTKTALSYVRAVRGGP